MEAALHSEGPLLILAGAGSGKTTTLVSRTGVLIDQGHVKANQMAVLTFTNKAARELKHRVERKLGHRSEGLWAGTFHSFGLSILRHYHKEANLEKYFGIVDQSDANAIVKDLLKELKNSAKENFDTDTLLSMLSRWREDNQKKAKLNDEYEIVTEWLLPKYIKKLEHLGVVDFDSLILKPLELMRSNPLIADEVQARYRQIMVDEFQDTNKTQMNLIDMLVKPHRNLTVVGDDDQSIYGWRGAQVANILNFPNVYKGAKVVRLERNYRSSDKILALANFVIEQNEQRHGKKLIPSLSVAATTPELFTFENDDFEVEGVVREIRELLAKGTPPKEVAVLYRSNSQGALVEVELRKQRIPYNISGGMAFFDRKEIKDILSYLRCSLMPNDVAFRRILNTPSRGIGETSIDQISGYAKAHRMSFVKATQSWQGARVNPKSGENIDQFFRFLKGFVPRLLSGPSTPGQNLIALLQELGYKHYLESISRDGLAVMKRWNLIEVFAQVVDKIVLKEGPATREKLYEFLNFMELRDSEDEDKPEEIQLMTLHASKGLEFDAVILLGLDEDILPHKNLGEDIQEERRLFYVGLTRARKHLIITRCKQRKRHGKTSPMTPSRFIMGIPENLMKTYTLGWRPVSEDQRQNLLADLFKKLGTPEAT